MEISTMFDDFHGFSMIFIDFNWIVNDCHWFSMIFIDVDWFSMIFIDLRWFALISMLPRLFNDFHWFSMVFIDVNWFSLILIYFHWFHWCSMKMLVSCEASSKTGPMSDTLLAPLAAWGWVLNYENQRFVWGFSEKQDQSRNPLWPPRRPEGGC